MSTVDTDASAAIRAALAANPDGVLDDIARKAGAPLQAALEALPTSAAVRVSGARFAEIWADLTSWGPVTFIVHNKDGVFETKAALPPGTEARGYFNIHGDGPLGGHLRADRCAAI
jgi:heme iron utilization protein